jgi:hypothetical protein
MVDYKKEVKNLEAIGEYLDKLDMDFDLKDAVDENNEKFPIILSTYKHKNINFAMHILSIDDWICMKVLLLDAENIKSELRCSIYQSCLELNFELPETTFSVNDGAIYIEADMPSGFSLGDFKLELEALKAGIDIFAEEAAPKTGKLKSTTEEAPAETTKKKSTKKKTTKKKTTKKKKKTTKKKK